MQWLVFTYSCTGKRFGSFIVEWYDWQCIYIFLTTKARFWNLYYNQVFSDWYILLQRRDMCICKSPGKEISNFYNFFRFTDSRELFRTSAKKCWHTTRIEWSIYIYIYTVFVMYSEYFIRNLLVTLQLWLLHRAVTRSWSQWSVIYRDTQTYLWDFYLRNVVSEIFCVLTEID